MQTYISLSVLNWSSYEHKGELIYPCFLTINLSFWGHAVEEPSEADIVWTHMQVDDEFRKAAKLRPDQYVNQFPSEACIVMKHNLAETMQKVLIFADLPFLTPA